MELLKNEPDDVGVLLLDSEYYYHNQPERLKRLERMGVDLNRLMIISENRIDQAFEVLKEVENSNSKGNRAICAIIIDSINGFEEPTASAKALNGELSKSANTFSGLSKILKNLAKILTGISARGGITTFLVAHCYLDQTYIGAGKKYIVSGGDQFKYFADNILLMTNVERKDAKIGFSGETLDKDKEKGSDLIFQGKTIRVQAQKSRNVVEGRKCDVKINFTTAEFIDKESSLFYLALNLEVIKKKSTQIYFVPKGDNATLELKATDSIKALRDNEDLFKYVLNKCMSITQRDAIDVSLGSDDIIEELTEEA